MSHPRRSSPIPSTMIPHKNAKHVAISGAV